MSTNQTRGRNRSKEAREERTDKVVQRLTIRVRSSAFGFSGAVVIQMAVTETHFPLFVVC